MSRRSCLAGLAAAFTSLALLAAMPARAAWPERPVQIVVPFGPGGGTDLTARLLGRFLERHTGGRPVVVQNRAGAGGEIGMTAVADAAPDGHTLVILNTPNVLTIPIERAARFRLDSFVPIANIVDDPGTLSVHSSSPIRSIAELVASAKARPGMLTYGTAGVGSAGHIAMLLVGRSAGISGTHVPFNGSAAVATALAGQQIEVATANFGEAIGFAGAGGNWRILGVMGPARMASHPDIPTFAEAGIPVQTGSLRGLGAPRGTPPETIAAITTALDAVMADPDYRAAMTQATQVIRYVKGAEYQALLRGMEADLRSLFAATPWNR
ncbi:MULTISPECIES: Bug family tripartite tricarboxylate transporter substrate binding protein [Roseomonadaceae]|uniref:Tripartite tricarboxylate transporter substrate binding protein n=1 Tax=Falsiroseomonas oleicola TaxID=2801474 RepID=A0ABS6HC73_9PROT|nr:tripartite tricarboxylate transporter substrate binding protein [Roseomonas oleicola]MBU8545397.1 tripartite tricarboxylate transporter substrate binding protein [Roseomonas oleicola]